MPAEYLKREQEYVSGFYSLCRRNISNNFLPFLLFFLCLSHCKEEVICQRLFLYAAFSPSSAVNNIVKISAYSKKFTAKIIPFHTSTLK